jgi:hypothetical protein
MSSLFEIPVAGQIRAKINMNTNSEAAFESVIEVYLQATGYVSVKPEGVDRERAIFPPVFLDFG